MLNKFRKFSFKLIIFENYFIYRFYVNLNSKHDNYFERYTQTHDAFKENNSFLHILSEIMQYCQNTIINSKIVIVENAIVFMIAMQEFIHQYRFTKMQKKSKTSIETSAMKSETKQCTLIRTKRS